MFSSIGGDSMSVRRRLFAGIVGMALFLWSMAALQPGAWAQARMAREAQLAAQGPMRLGIKPLAKSYAVGEQIQLEVTLLDAFDHAVGAPAAIPVVVESVTSSGKKSFVKLAFSPGQSVLPFKLYAAEEGLVRITVRHAENQLREGYYAIMVGKPAPRPAAKPAPKAKAVKIGSLHPAWPEIWASDMPAKQPWGPSIYPAVYRRPSSRSGMARVWFSPEEEDAWNTVASAALVSGLSYSNRNLPPQPQAARHPAGAKLIFDVPGAQQDGSGPVFLADGRDAARILVFYASPDGGAAPSEIRVWLTWTNGELEPQPVLIHAGEAFAEARLRSSWPADARVEFVTSAPPLPLEGARKYTVKFGPPIYGINVVGVQRLSLVEDGLLLVEFFDQYGNPIQTATNRTVTFMPTSPHLRLQPTQVVVPPGNSSTSVALMPVRLGHGKLNVSTPGYKTVSLDVEVTGMSMILLCLAGGVVGGVCAFNAFKGVLLWRLFLGIVGGAVLSWLYVFLALPNVDLRIAHNLVSVLFVSIIGGWAGTKVLDLAAKQFGMGK